MEKFARSKKRRRESTTYIIEFSNKAKRILNKVEKRLMRYYPATRSKFHSDLLKKMEFLETFPFLYPIYNKNQRKIPLKYNYILLYEVRENKIIISNILNSKQIH